MLIRRSEWRKRLDGFMTITRRLLTVSMWSNINRRKSGRVDHEWEIISFQELDDVPKVNEASSTLSPLSVHRLIEEAHARLPSLQNQNLSDKLRRSSQLHQLVNLSGSEALSIQEEEKRTKRFTLREFSFSIQCSPSELPEDIERLIFEMAAREDPIGALNTLVFVNHRVRKW